MNVFVEKILRAGGGNGYADDEARLRQVRQSGREFAIEPGKRAEFPIEAGERAVVYLLEGNARFEGDDTPATEGDTVWFKPAPQGALLGVEADTPVRGILISARM